MTEEQLNKEYIKNRLSKYNPSKELINEILKLCSERYIEGLRQGKIDRLIIERENELMKVELIECKVYNRQLTNELEKVKEGSNNEN